MRFEILKVSELIENPNNPRVMKKEAYDRMVRDLRAGKSQGLIKSAVLVATREDGKFDIVDGHHRVKALREVGIDETPAIVAESYEEREQLADLITMNEPVAKLDLIKVSDIITKLRELGWDWIKIQERLGYKEQQVLDFANLKKFDFANFQFTPAEVLAGEVTEPFMVKMTVGQRNVVEKALEMITEASGTKISRGTALEMLCAEYLAS